MKFAMCNEFCQGWSLEDAMSLARDAGYEGVEVAPFTLAESVLDIPASQRDRWRSLAAEKGLELIGLHWLLVKPAGLSINCPKPEVRRRTAAYFRALIDFCADLGGDRLVIGSPKNRSLQPGLDYDQAWNNTVEFLKSLTDAAEARQVNLCIEPLAVTETDFINTVAEGVRLCKAVGHDRCRVHLDVKAMSGEGKPLDECIRDGRGYVSHLHVNDANLQGPGWGDTDYAPIVKGCRDIGYDDYASVEVFDFSPSPEDIARKSIAFLRKVF